jgi:hypothetical protein
MAFTYILPSLSAGKSTSFSQDTAKSDARITTPSQTRHDIFIFPVFFIAKI